MAEIGVRNGMNFSKDHWAPLARTIHRRVKYLATRGRATHTPMERSKACQGTGMRLIPKRSFPSAR